MRKVKNMDLKCINSMKIPEHGSCVKTGSKYTNQRAGIWTNRNVAFLTSATHLAAQRTNRRPEASSRQPAHQERYKTKQGGRILITLLSQISKLTHLRRRIFRVCSTRTRIRRIIRVHSTRTRLRCITRVRPTRTRNRRLVQPWHELSSLTARRMETVRRVPLTPTSVAYAAKKVCSPQTTAAI